MPIEELPPQTPEEIAAELRTLLATCNVQLVDEEACEEIDYKIEQLLSLARANANLDAAIHEMCEMCRDGIGVDNFPNGWFHSEHLSEPSKYGSWPWPCYATRLHDQKNGIKR